MECGGKKQLGLLKAVFRLAKQSLLWSLFPLIWIMVQVLRRLSLEARFKVVKAMASFIYWLWLGRRARIKKNLILLRPDLDEGRIAEGSWRVIKTVARSWAALLGNKDINFGEVMRKLEVKGIETLIEYHRNGKKIIAVAGHVGPFDEMIGIIPGFGLRVYVPVEPIKPVWFLNLMMQLRLGSGDIIFEPVKKGHTLSRSAHHLANGRIVLLMMDVIRHDSSGVLCRIGGAQARFSVGAVKLALEQEATIFPVFPSWIEGRKLQVIVGSPFELIKTGNRQRDIEVNTRRLVEEVYAPHIRENWDSWVRVLWSKLEPVPSRVSTLKKEN